jgi:tRNA nucleotidyltransferase (CCA-adding enzyme)
MDVNSKAQQIINLLELAGYEAYVVGGCTRDMLLGREPKDWDIATNALPDQILDVCSKYHTIPTGLKHGTVTVLVDGEQFEVTTYRIDGNYSDNRRPDSVEFTSSIVEDLRRRDFTINAIAYHPGRGIIDPFNGKLDLHNRMIRAVDNPHDRFNEDALRMLRAIRFACELDFSIDKYTKNAMYDNCHLIKNVSIERIREETNKILISDYPSYGLSMLIQFNLLRLIIPEIYQLIKFDQFNPHHDKDVFDHTLVVIESVPKSLVLRWAALLHDIGKPASFTMVDGFGHFYNHHKIGADMAREILRRLKFDNNTIERVCILIYNHMSRFEFLRSASIKRFINRVGVENLDDLFKLQIADIKGSANPNDFSQVEKLKVDVEKILSEKQPLTVKDLAVNGYDLMEMGFKQGKELGNILKFLLEEVLKNPELNQKKLLLNMVNE